jgi:hypothetical protein
MCRVWLSCLLAYFLCAVHAQEGKCWGTTNCTGPLKEAFKGPWSNNIFAPASRTIWPQRVLNSVGNFTGNYYPLSNMLQGNGSQIVFDFGIEVGGILTLDYGTSGKATIGMAFTEGKTWIGEWSDSSNGNFQGSDGQLYAKASKQNSLAAAQPHQSRAICRWIN